MTTHNPRVNVTLDEELLAALKLAARRTKKSLSAVAKEMIVRGIDLDEDIYLSTLADTRLRSNKKRLSHDAFWQQALQD